VAVAYQRKALRRRTRWVLQWVDPATGQLRQKSVQAKDKREADRLEFELQRRAQRQREGLEPLHAEDGGGTLGRLLERWLAATRHLASAERNESTIRKHLLTSALAGLVLAQLRASDVENFLDEKLAAGLSPQSVNHLRNFISRAFTTAERKGWWAGPNVVRKVTAKEVPEDNTAGDSLEAEEVPAVLAKLSIRWRAFFAVAIYAGLRKSELRALRKKDIDLKRRLLFVRRSGDRDTTKGKHAEAIPIHPELLPFLSHAVETSASELVFPAEDGQMVREDVKLQAMLRRAMARAGLFTHVTHVCRRKGCQHRENAPDSSPRRCPEHRCLLWPKPHVRDFRFHDLRHTAATLLLTSGVPLVVVSKILRHADVNLTLKRYGHLVPDYLQAEISSMRLLAETQAAELVPMPLAASARTAPARHETPDDEPPGGGGGNSPGLPGASDERETGVEPATLGLGSRCSTTELLPLTPRVQITDRVPTARTCEAAGAPEAASSALLSSEPTPPQ